MVTVSPIFSIIVPVYNVEEDLERCVSALTSQTLQDLEIILVDDGSTDSSAVLCDRFSFQDSRIRVIHKANGGLSDARNEGLKIAVGEYIMFVDSDDYIDVDSCEKLAAYLRCSPDIVIGDAYLEGGYSNVEHADFPKGFSFSGKEYMKEAYLQKAMPPAVWLNIYRREYLEQSDICFKKGILHEDIEFTPRVFYHADSVVFSGQRFYHYVIRGGSIMNAKNKDQNFIDVHNTCLELEQYFSNEHDVELKSLILDDLLGSYLYRFRQVSGLEPVRGSIDRKFVLRNISIGTRTVKCLLFLASPRLYLLAGRMAVK